MPRLRKRNKLARLQLESLEQREVPAVFMESIPFDPNAQEGGTTAHFAVGRIGDLSQPLSIYLDPGGVGTFHYQYTLSLDGFGAITPGTPFTMGANVDRVTFTLTATDDDLVEPTQHVTMQLEENPSYNLGTPNSAILHIIDNDNPPPGGPNEPPVAAADSYSVVHDRTLSVSLAEGLLANDSDPNGGQITKSITAENKLKIDPQIVWWLVVVDPADATKTKNIPLGTSGSHRVYVTVDTPRNHTLLADMEPTDVRLERAVSVVGTAITKARTRANTLTPTNSRVVYEILRQH